MIRSRAMLLALSLLASTASAPAAALPAAPQADPILVQGRNGALVRSYVDRVARPEPGRQLARWHQPLCVRYDGVADRFASYLRARLVAVAQDVRVAVAAPGCGVNTVVRLTGDADGLAHDLVHMRHPPIGNITYSDDRTLPRRTVLALETPRPVRWLSGSATVTNDGMPIYSAVVPQWSASLIRSPTREDMVSKIILLDERRIAGVTMDQLADYLAFVTLAAPDIAADYAGTDSIMALYAGGPGARPPGLTQQDRAFLDALYATPADRPVRDQQGAIRARVKRGAPQS